MQTGKDCIKTSSIKLPKQNIIRVLLNSGSDGDLMFHEKGAKKLSLPDKANSKVLEYVKWDFPHEGKRKFQVDFVNTAIVSL